MKRLNRSKKREALMIYKSIIKIIKEGLTQLLKEIDEVDRCVK